MSDCTGFFFFRLHGSYLVLVFTLFISSLMHSIDYHAEPVCKECILIKHAQQQSFNIPSHLTGEGKKGLICYADVD